MVLLFIFIFIYAEIGKKKKCGRHIHTDWPCIAATWAAFGKYPGGGGGITGDFPLNRAPASNIAVCYGRKKKLTNRKIKQYEKGEMDANALYVFSHILNREKWNQEHA